MSVEKIDNDAFNFFKSYEIKCEVPQIYRGCYSNLLFHSGTLPRPTFGCGIVSVISQTQTNSFYAPGKQQYVLNIMQLTNKC